MRNEEAASTPAGDDYAVAYSAHYKAKDLNEALTLYQGVIGAHPDSPEAGFSRSQVGNIARAVVPKEELLDAQVGMVLAQLAKSTASE